MAGAQPTFQSTPASGGSVAFMLRALKYRNYRLFFGGQIVSLTGTWITTTATSWLVYRITGSAMLLGVAIAIALARSRVRAIKGIRISVVLVAASIVFFLYCYPRMADLQAPYDCAFGCWV